MTTAIDDWIDFGRVLSRAKEKGILLSRAVLVPDAPLLAVPKAKYTDRLKRWNKEVKDRFTGTLPQACLADGNGGFLELSYPIHDWDGSDLYKVFHDWLLDEGLFRDVKVWFEGERIDKVETHSDTYGVPGVIVKTYKPRECRLAVYF